MEFRPYKPEDFIKIRDFLIDTYETNCKNWAIERWSFVRYFDVFLLDTIKQWEDKVGIWEDIDGKIMGVAHTEGHISGEAIFQIGPNITNSILEEMFNYAEENFFSE